MDKLYNKYKAERNGGERGRTQTDPQLLRWYLRGWVPTSSMSVLDIGCGGGELLEFLRNEGVVNVKGIDLSPSQVEIARKRGLNVQMCEALEFLESVDEEFDVIVILDVLEHIPRENVLGLIAAMRRRLKPDGFIIGQVPNGDSPEVGTIFWDDATHVWCYTPNSIRQLFIACGEWEFEFRESVIPPTKPLWILRWLYWRVRSALVQLSRMLEHGSRGSGVVSRVFRFRAVKLGKTS